MPRRDAGSLGPGQSRTFELTAHLPDGGRPQSPTAGDNAFKGSTASVRYVWTATESGVAPAPAPSPAAACRASLRVPVGQALLRRRRMVARVRVSSTCRANVYACVLDGTGRKRFLFGARGRSLVAGRPHRREPAPGARGAQHPAQPAAEVVRVRVLAGSTAVNRRARCGS